MNDSVNFYDATFLEAPYKYESGTQPIAEAIGFKEAVRYLEALDMNEVQLHEEELIAYAMPKLLAIDGIEVYNPHTDTGIVSFNVIGVHPHDAASMLDEQGIALRAGHHCAQLVSKWLKCSGTLRATFYLYNTYEDVDRLVAALKETVEFFGGWK